MGEPKKGQAFHSTRRDRWKKRSVSYAALQWSGSVIIATDPSVRSIASPSNWVLRKAEWFATHAMSTLSTYRKERPSRGLRGTESTLFSLPSQSNKGRFIRCANWTNQRAWREITRSSYQSRRQKSASGLSVHFCSTVPQRPLACKQVRVQCSSPYAQLHDAYAH